MKLIVPLLIGALAACTDPDSGPVTVTPKTVTVKAGEKTTFSASVKDAKDPRVLWSVEGGDSHGTISSTGVYTAPAEAGSYTVVATNAVDTSKTDTATVKVEAVQAPTVIVKVTPTTATIGQGTVTNLTAEVSGSSITAVQWSVDGGDENGTVSSTGRYTAPHKSGTFNVTATSVADPTKKASAAITVEPVVVEEVKVTVSPSSGTTTWDGTVHLTAEVTGTNNLAVLWSVEGGDANGFVSSTGVYRAPNKTGTFTVTATSVADPTKKASASIKVDPVVAAEVVVTVSPKTANVAQDAAFSLSAEVTGTNLTAVQWSVEGGDQNGTVSSTGVYRAPRHAGTFVVRAVSVVDPTKSDSATITVDDIVVPVVAVTVTPKTATVSQNGGVKLSAEVTGSSNTAVQWSVEGGDDNGFVSSTGTYHAPNKAGTFTVTATSVADPTKSDSATITVDPVIVPVVAVAVTPKTATVSQNGTTNLSAEVTGSANTAVQWSVVGGDANGFVSSTGVYHAPNKAGTFTVTATSVADASKSDSATITVEPIVVPTVAVAVTPKTATVSQNGTVNLSAEVTGSSNTAVQWSVVGGDANGFVSSTGVYHAPNKAGTFTVTATSVADASKSDSATLTVDPIVVPTVAVTVSPKTGNVAQDATISLSASVTGSSNTAVLWEVVGGDANGYVSSTGVYRAPKKAGTFTVTATSVADPTKSDSATITVDPIVVPTVAVTVSPKTGNVAQDATITLTASVTGTSNTAVLWTVVGGGSNGYVSSTGVYRAPKKAGTFTVVATSVADSSKSDSATITVDPIVVPTVAVTVTPKTATVAVDGSVSLSASVTGTSNTQVLWTVQGGDANGYVSTTGVYRAPSQAGTYTVTATSVADASKSDSATITVNPVVVPTVAVSVTPKTATVEQGAVVNLSASVTGTSVVAVTWAVAGGSANGTVTSSGVYTAPNKPGTYTVTATSVADASKSDSATITVPVAGTVKYVDPTGTGWRLVRNASLSSGNTLVLDLVGPTGQSSRGADLTLALDAATASWSTVDGSEYVANRGYNLGAAPQLLKSGVKGSTLSVGVYQKGAAATAHSGALLSVALTVKATAQTPAGTVVPLNVLKGHALPASGSLQAIDVAVGTITTAQ
ncbi:hypothetical protein JY651_44735 [Pyxidicoccus parkwayensis]|uniref:Ig-like domain-containing protein n=1 Tax=Pyxidicoccus parkwayensis TaxID=2813578 RepID=A0ABX7NXH8_9BACT|nr:hypothetical protein [Pyxidicoccus parkwaysis]QSQ22165.1 hypothetical protein JY651_44735 [Pyxidicoccus parkwaysis]